MEKTRNRQSVWFWYNPVRDCIVQEQSGAETMLGLFESKGSAYRFLESYAASYGISDTSHLQLYEATLTLQGFGDEVPRSNPGPQPSNDAVPYPTRSRTSDHQRLDELL